MLIDSELKKSVLAELAWEPSVNAAHIGVTAHAGVIALSGHVESFSEKYAAEKAAHRVNGVKAVAEEIEVKLPYAIKRTDEDIALAASNHVAWDASLSKFGLQVMVEKGWITLTGEVDWQYQRYDAEHAVRNLLGVVGVSDQITIKPHVNTANIGENIRNALHRTWYDVDGINVSAENGKVKLTGSVDNWHDWQLASTTSWAAPGVNSVDNQITIN